MNTVNINHTYDNSASFLDRNRPLYSKKEFALLSDILTEWCEASSITDVLAHWKSYEKAPTQEPVKSLHVLCFNVRGFEQRWTEVCLLAKTDQADVIVLNEVGRVDMVLVGASFLNFQVSYQAGENSHGGVLVMIRNGITVSRINCCVPNVCVIDLKLQKPIRIIGMYAPASKSWQWADLSSFISKQCVVIGDFNVDLEKDGDKADQMLEWMDACAVGAILPNANTSLRADRIIDYALTTGLDMSIQAYEGPTTSDHKPLLGVIAVDELRKAEGFRTVWSVFTSVLAFTSGYWEKRWRNGSYDDVYGEFIALLSTLESRCKEYFPVKHARPSIPREIMILLA